MSDGPHRTLPMPRAWKKVAEVADNKAFETTDVSSRVTYAVEKDFSKDVSDELAKGIRDSCDNQLPGLGTEQLKSLWPIASSPFSELLLDYCIQASTEGKFGADGYLNATENALREYTIRCGRQVEEHYHRKSTANRAVSVRDRIEESIDGVAFEASARRVWKIDKNPLVSLAKHEGLDDGVLL